MVVGTWESVGAPPPATWLADWGRQVSFFESTNFNEMMPRDDLKFGGTTYVLAKPGESYIAYAPALTGSLIAIVTPFNGGTSTATYRGNIRSGSPSRMRGRAAASAPS